jgi:hypothetical protein
MDESPVTLLEDLLTREPGPENAHYLKTSRDFFGDDWTYEEMQAVEEEFAQDFRTAAARVEAVWGPPDFLGTRAESEFPEFYTAEEFCYWRKGDRLAMIWWEHQDKEAPVCLTLAALTPEDLGG